LEVASRREADHALELPSEVRLVAETDLRSDHSDRPPGSKEGLGTPYSNLRLVRMGGHPHSPVEDSTEMEGAEASDPGQTLQGHVLRCMLLEVLPTQADGPVLPPRHSRVLRRHRMAADEQYERLQEIARPLEGARSRPLRELVEPHETRHDLPISYDIAAERRHHRAVSIPKGAKSMLTHDWATLLTDARREALEFLEGLPGREIQPSASLSELRESFGGPLPEGPSDPRAVVAELGKAADRGLLATAGGRFFGFVMGGALPASVGAEWLTAAWDQCPAFLALSPAAAVAEQAAASWLLDLFDLPRHASVGFVTGTQMAHFTGLAAGRNAVLRRAGWDVETDGLVGAPPVSVLAGRERHVTVDRALRFLGLGTARLREVEADEQGRMRPDALAAALRDVAQPIVVCAQVGNVNSGALDPVGEICEIAHERSAWVHVDGAFGLWAAASPSLRPLTRGMERADSWATDAHKWLNVTYDSGIAICAHPDAHRAAMTAASASYFPQAGERDAMEWNPELGRRARGFALWAALRSLGAWGSPISSTGAACSPVDSPRPWRPQAASASSTMWSSIRCRRQR
jgi:glutamate/tyrosine decarboxylase-like PLP-dependent enzyme